MDRGWELTPELVVVGAAFCLSAAVAHLTAVLLVVDPGTELLSLQTHTRSTHKGKSTLDHTGQQGTD